LWTGSAASWVDLHPAGSTGSEALGTCGTYQVGWAQFNNQLHAGVWNGSSDSWDDLSFTLPGSWDLSVAEGVWSDGSTLYITGSGHTSDGLDVALLWSRPIPTPGAAGALLLAALITTRRR